MSKKNLWGVAVTAAALLAAAHGTLANPTLGPPLIDGYANSDWPGGVSVSMPSAGGLIVGGVGDETSASAYYAAGAGSVSASQAFWEYGGNDIEAAQARVLSEFEVLGPSDSDASVVFTANGSATTAGSILADATAYAWVGSSIDSSDIYAAQADACIYFGATGICGAPSTSSSFSVDYQFNVTTNTPYYLTIVAQGSSNNGTFSAWVDPSVVFASGFDSAGYSLIYSADATPSPAPEPGPLFLGGLGTIGLWLARRRQLRNMMGDIRKN
jgi:fluoride ion exporter CrcB/FEX